MNKITR